MMRLRDEMPELGGATVWYNSEPIQKRDLIGNEPTRIHYWSVSCDLCKKSMPNVNEFRKAYTDELTVNAVHMPRSGKELNRAEVKKVAAEHDIPQPSHADNKHLVTDARNLRGV